MNEKTAQRWTGTGSIPTSPIYPVLEKNLYYNNGMFVSVQLIVLSGKWNWASGSARECAHTPTRGHVGERREIINTLFIP